MKEMSETENPPDKIFPGEGLWGGRLLFFASLPSTNQWAERHLSVCRHGDVIWTTNQTSGLGRLNRSWITPANKALTLSFILFDLPQGIVTVLSQLAALAVQRMLNALSVHSKLKWPNDILVDGKKIAGILSETDMRKRVSIVGVGLNVNMRPADFILIPPDQPATSILIEKSKLSLKKARILLSDIMENVLEEATYRGASELLSGWKDRDWLESSVIEVCSQNGSVRGNYDGLHEDGRLRLIDSKGRLQLFWAGDVRKIQSL